MGIVVVSLLFAIVFAIMALQSLDRREYGWVLILIIMAVANGTMFVLKLLEVIHNG